MQARSQLLLMNPLPTVTQAYAMIMNDKSQKSSAINYTGLLGVAPNIYDPVVMYSKSGSSKFRKERDYNLQCDHCKMRGISKKNAISL